MGEFANTQASLVLNQKNDTHPSAVSEVLHEIDG